MSAPASPEFFVAYKDSLDAVIAKEAADIGALYLQQITLEGANPQTMFHDAAEAETRTAHARFDNLRDALIRNHVERLTRWASRMWGIAIRGARS